MMTDEQVAVLAAATFLADRSWAVANDVEHYASTMLIAIRRLKENNE